MSKQSLFKYIYAIFVLTVYKYFVFFYFKLIFFCIFGLFWYDEVKNNFFKKKYYSDAFLKKKHFEKKYLS
jgi:hypothetical protein